MGKKGRGGGGADGGDLLGPGDLPSNEEGGGAGVGADDGVDADDVYKLADSFEGRVGIAGGVDGETLDGLSEDAASLI